MAIIQNITIDQDCDYTETLTIKDSTGTVVDLTDETITSTLRKTYSSSTKHDFTTAKVSATGYPAKRKTAKSTNNRIEKNS